MIVRETMGVAGRETKMPDTPVGNRTISTLSPEESDRQEFESGIGTENAVRSNLVKNFE
jgi:hypothetical protein